MARRRARPAAQASRTRSAANNWPAASLFHTTTEPESLPVNSPIGTVVVVMSPRSAHASRARSQMWAPVVDGQRAGGRVRHRIPPQRVEQHGRAGGAVQQRRHELALVDHPVQVGPRRGAGADEAERVAAVELLAAGGQVDAGERVADRFGRAHRHSADCVDEDGEPVEPDLGVVVEPQPGGLLDGLRQQRGAADRRTPR